MDTSETYIKMCQKATEIQAVWKPAEGDYFYQPTSRPFLEGQFCVYDVRLLIRGPESGRLCFPEIVSGGPWGEYNEDGLEYIDDTARLIWLPRQDQFQEMIEGTAPAVLMAFANEAFDRDHDWIEVIAPYKALASMEQMWLCYVMSERYQRRWTGEEWA